MMEVYRGRDIEKVIESVAKLRIAVFREYPYLYDGDISYEEKYLQTYLKCARSVVGVEKVDGVVVGATTALPFTEGQEQLQKVFTDAGYNVEEFFYFGESVVLPEFRSGGIGQRFMDLRLQEARAYPEYSKVCFCAVSRAENDPKKPLHYKGPASLWLRNGFVQRKDLVSSMRWKEIGEDIGTEKPMQFWIKELR